MGKSALTPRIPLNLPRSTNTPILRKIVSSHKSRTLNLDTKFWLKKCVNYASKYVIWDGDGRIQD